MKKKNKTEKEEKDKVQETTQNIEEGNIKENTETTETNQCQSEEDKLKIQLSEANDKYIRLVAEFDNYKKRTLKERMELIKTAGEDLLKKLLPVVDDIERAKANIDNAKDLEAIKTGIELISNKFIDFLKQQGVQQIEALNKDFDTDHHEAVTKIPSPNPEMKGKVIDVVKNGYCLHDKVIRFAQVVVGE